MESIKHKFIEKNFGNGFSTKNAILLETPYKPEILFLGTFNPNTDENSNIADFFYGRNWFWPALFNIFENNNFEYIKQRKYYNPLEPSLNQILNFSKNHKLTFADLITEVLIKEKTDYKLVKNKVLINEKSFDLINDGDLSKLDKLQEVAWSTNAVIAYLKQNGSIKSVYITSKPRGQFLCHWNNILNYDYGREINFYKIFTPAARNLKGSPLIKSLIKHWTSTEDNSYNRLDEEWLNNAKLDYKSIDDNSNIIKKRQDSSQFLKNKKSENKSNFSQNNKNSLENTNNTYSVTLGKEYYYKGIIPIPTKFRDSLPNKTGFDVEIEIENYKTLVGTCTISGSNRKINGREELKEWFNRHYHFNDTIQVVFISPYHYKITKG